MVRAPSGPLLDVEIGGGGWVVLLWMIQWRLVMCVRPLGPSLWDLFSGPDVPSQTDLE